VRRAIHHRRRVGWRAAARRRWLVDRVGGEFGGLSYRQHIQEFIAEVSQARFRPGRSEFRRGHRAPRCGARPSHISSRKPSSSATASLAWLRWPPANRPAYRSPSPITGVSHPEPISNSANPMRCWWTCSATIRPTTPSSAAHGASGRRALRSSQRAGGRRQRRIGGCRRRGHHGVRANSSGAPRAGPTPRIRRRGLGADLDARKRNRASPLPVGAGHARPLTWPWARTPPGSEQVRKHACHQHRQHRHHRSFVVAGLLQQPASQDGSDDPATLHAQF